MNKQEIDAFLQVFIDAKAEVAKWPAWMQASAVEATASFPKTEVREHWEGPLPRAVKPVSLPPQLEGMTSLRARQVLNQLKLDELITAVEEVIDESDNNIACIEGLLVAYKEYKAVQNNIACIEGLLVAYKEYKAVQND